MSMYYQLPSGRTIDISVEQFLEMTDEDIEYLIAYNHGHIIEQPFHGSSLSIGIKAEEEEITPEIPDIDSLDKLDDLDMDIYVEI